MGCTSFLVCLFVVVNCFDVGLIGFECKDSSNLTEFLLARKNVVGIYEEQQEGSDARKFLSKGTFRSFASVENLVQFGQVVHLCLENSEKIIQVMNSISSENRSGKVFVLWNVEEQIKLEIEQAKLEFSFVVARLQEGVPVIKGDRHYVSRALKSIVEFKSACPLQGEFPQLATEKVDVGCGSDLAVCRLFVKLEDPTDRLHAIIVNSEADVSTDDPEGFVKVFGSPIVLSGNVIRSSPDGKCDSFLTMGKFCLFKV